MCHVYPNNDPKIIPLLLLVVFLLSEKTGTILRRELPDCDSKVNRSRGATVNLHVGRENVPFSSSRINTSALPAQSEADNCADITKDAATLDLSC